VKGDIFFILGAVVIACTLVYWIITQWPNALRYVAVCVLTGLLYAGIGPLIGLIATGALPLLILSHDGPILLLLVFAIGGIPAAVTGLITSAVSLKVRRRSTLLLVGLFLGFTTSVSVSLIHDGVPRPLPIWLHRMGGLFMFGAVGAVASIPCTLLAFSVRLIPLKQLKVAPAS
jgi:hypothetical protein